MEEHETPKNIEKINKWLEDRPNIKEILSTRIMEDHNFNENRK